MRLEPKGRSDTTPSSGQQRSLGGAVTALDTAVTALADYMASKQSKQMASKLTEWLGDKSYQKRILNLKKMLTSLLEGDVMTMNLVDSSFKDYALFMRALEAAFNSSDAELLYKLEQLKPLFECCEMGGALNLKIKESQIRQLGQSSRDLPAWFSDEAIKGKVSEIIRECKDNSAMCDVLPASDETIHAYLRIYVIGSIDLHNVAKNSGEVTQRRNDLKGVCVLGEDSEEKFAQINAALLKSLDSWIDQGKQHCITMILGEWIDIKAVDQRFAACMLIIGLEENLIRSLRSLLFPELLGVPLRLKYQAVNGLFKLDLRCGDSQSALITSADKSRYMTVGYLVHHLLNRDNGCSCPYRREMEFEISPDKVKSMIEYIKNELGQKKRQACQLLSLLLGDDVEITTPYIPYDKVTPENRSEVHFDELSSVGASNLMIILFDCVMITRLDRYPKDHPIHWVLQSIVGESYRPDLSLTHATREPSADVLSLDGVLDRNNRSIFEWLALVDFNSHFCVRKSASLSSAEQPMSDVCDRGSLLTLILLSFMKDLPKDIEKLLIEYKYDHFYFRLLKGNYRDVIPALRQRVNRNTLNAKWRVLLKRNRQVEGSDHDGVFSGASGGGSSSDEPDLRQGAVHGGGGDFAAKITASDEVCDVAERASCSASMGGVRALVHPSDGRRFSVLEARSADQSLQKSLIEHLRIKYVDRTLGANHSAGSYSLSDLEFNDQISAPITALVQLLYGAGQESSLNVSRKNFRRWATVVIKQNEFNISEESIWLSLISLNEYTQQSSDAGPGAAHETAIDGCDMDLVGHTYRVLEILMKENGLASKVELCIKSFVDQAFQEDGDNQRRQYSWLYAEKHALYEALGLSPLTDNGSATLKDQRQHQYIRQLDCRLQPASLVTAVVDRVMSDLEFITITKAPGVVSQHLVDLFETLGFFKTEKNERTCLERRQYVEHAFRLIPGNEQSPWNLAKISHVVFVKVVAFMIQRKYFIAFTKVRSLDAGQSYISGGVTLAHILSSGFVEHSDRRPAASTGPTAAASTDPTEGNQSSILSAERSRLLTSGSHSRLYQGLSRQVDEQLDHFSEGDVPTYRSYPQATIISDNRPGWWNGGCSDQTLPVTDIRNEEYPHSASTGPTSAASTDLTSAASTDPTAAASTDPTEGNRSSILSAERSRLLTSGSHSRLYQGLSRQVDEQRNELSELRGSVNPSCHLDRSEQQLDIRNEEYPEQQQDYRNEECPEQQQDYRNEEYPHYDSV